MTYYLTPFGANPTFSVSWTPTQTWATATASGTTATMNMTPQTIQYGITNDQAGQTQSSSWPGYGSQSQPATSSFTQQIWVSDLSDLEVFQDWLMDQSRTLNMFKSHLEDILRMAEWKEFTSSGANPADIHRNIAADPNFVSDKVEEQRSKAGQSA